MKRWIVIIISIVLLILDNSFMPFISIYGIYPSLLFVFAIGYSIINGKQEGVFIGVLTGILQDIFFVRCFGLNALINMLICYIVGRVGEDIWKEKKLIPIITIIASTIVKNTVMYFFMLVLKYNIELINGIYIAIYNSVIMFFTYRFMYKVWGKNKKEFTWRDRSR
ncbi:MAG: rod shape-determining protein MreD [Clostridium sp.]|nr:rod shape-determining protein MreD [Clostridium sp.]MDY3827172.1 rod shape-determining protein MreD [Clostridium sp.]